jgi:hypothetical protein
MQEWRCHPHNSLFSNPISCFIGKTVLVECEPGLTVEGRLIRYVLGYQEGHLPTVLIVQNEHGFIILRSWKTIKTTEKVFA